MHPAKIQAQEHVELNGFPDAPRRVLDTHCGDAAAWTITETETGAVIVYEDDPDSVCSVGNEPGRFVAGE